MDGSARAPAAGTVLNAIATGTGSAFAIDEYVHATVSLNRGEETITGHVADRPDADPSLIEEAVSLTLETVGVDAGGSVETRSDVPMASGLKSSSAAANACVIATLAATDHELHRLDAARIGVDAARNTGVTVTGAFDDATASMLGGLTVTDNDNDELLYQDEFDTPVLVWTPPQRAYSRDANVDRCRRVTPVAEHIETLVLDGQYTLAMTVNGLAFSAALEQDPTPILEALPTADGATISGTGPSFIAVGSETALRTVRDHWATREGTTWMTTTQHTGATTT